MRIGALLAKRAALAVVTLWLLSVLVFAACQLLPGDERVALRGPVPPLRPRRQRAVAPRADLIAAHHRQPIRMHDAGVAGPGLLQGEAPRRVVVQPDVVARRPVASLARDAQLGHLGGVADHPPGGVADGVLGRAGVVAVEATVVPGVAAALRPEVHRRFV